MSQQEKTAQDLVPCTVCGEVKCLSPAKVSELMLGFVTDLHARLMQLDLKGHMGLKWTVAHYESVVQSYMAHWGWALRGVCGTCVPAKEPALAELFEAPHYQHFLAMLRWDVLVPEPPAVRVLDLELQPVVALAERLAGLADWSPYTPETLAADTALLGRARAEAEAWAASLPRAQPAKES